MDSKTKELVKIILVELNNSGPLGILELKTKTNASSYAILEALDKKLIDIVDNVNNLSVYAITTAGEKTLNNE